MSRLTISFLEILRSVPLGMLIILSFSTKIYSGKFETNGWRLLEIGMSLREAHKIINTICIDVEKDWIYDRTYLNCNVLFYGHPVQSIIARGRDSFFFWEKLHNLEIKFSNINKLEQLEKTFDKKWNVSKDWECDEKKERVTNNVETYCTKQYKILGDYDGESGEMNNLLTEYKNHLTMEYCSPFYLFCD